MLNRKGQNIAEYSILIALVIAAAVGMQVYVKRGIQARVLNTVDHAVDGGVGGTVGDRSFTFATKQYEPYYTDSAADVSSTRGLNENLAQRGQTGHTGISEDTKKAQGSYDQSLWQGESAR